VPLRRLHQHHLVLGQTIAVVVVLAALGEQRVVVIDDA
jgi:hypothetical protein